MHGIGCWWRIRQTMPAFIEAYQAMIQTGYHAVPVSQVTAQRVDEHQRDAIRQPVLPIMKRNPVNCEKFHFYLFARLSCNRQRQLVKASEVGCMDTLGMF